MNKILVGFDGSEGAEQALNRAMMLIDEYGEIVLLAVIPSRESFVDDGVYKTLEKKAHVLISDAVNDLGSHDFEIKGIVKVGDAAEIIIDTASMLNVDLIVLGSKGTSELGRYLLGSVANKVVQYAHKPVMVVR